MHALKKNRPLRRIVLASAATVSGMVLLLSLKPHTSPTVATASTKSPVSSSSSGAPGTGTRTVTGDTVQTRWGPVRVRVTIKSGRLTDLTAVSYPQDNPRDQEINGYALPQLRREALAAQSAQIDTVSGATYTSDGYRRSLQSALDSAGL
ncbi:FMN-binding protein [Streptomyces cellostaticus]|uniref:FMN-binding protein n=1 Tax=Streptomyces cellostaticus TaxID=67285 RepID=A0A101NP18_9ACTN|nr:FMN-binding protein [Streptomyces cellostaticus]KUM96559.1 FMN-binding protein [Streptomyces cellostaticus]GHI09036.1 FMN-binding protein [Streptomyces cellostaticus]